MRDEERHLSLEEGRDLYLASVDQVDPISGRVTRAQKRRRAVFDKFVPFFSSRVLPCARRSTRTCSSDTSRGLSRKGYSYRTRYLEVTTIKQWVRFLVEGDLLQQSSLIKFDTPKPSAMGTYCFQPDEIAAILGRCRKTVDLLWMYAVVATLV